MWRMQIAFFNNKRQCTSELPVLLDFLKRFPVMKRKQSYTDGPDIPEIAIKVFPFDVCLHPDCSLPS